MTIAILNDLRGDATAASSQKVHYSGTHRTVDPDVSYKRIAAVLPAIGVTRVADVTGLDYIGIPTITTFRPNARSISVNQGKGASLLHASVSSMMESLECHCMERAAPDMANRPIKDMAGVNWIIPAQTLVSAELPDGPVDWRRGVNLFGGGEIYLPEEIVSCDFARDDRRDRPLFVSGSNGVAAGNTTMEAVLHALCELIERDALALWTRAPAAYRAARRVDPASCDDPHVRFYLEQYRRSKIRVDVYDMTSDLGVPAFLCTLDDIYGLQPYLGRSSGSGAHPSPAVALCRALSEAAQTRLTLIAGARDDLASSDYAQIRWEADIGSLLRHSVIQPPGSARAIATPSIASADIGQDVANVLARLTSCGSDRAILFDLTDPAIGIPCVRLVVPVLENFQPGRSDPPGPRARKWMQQWR